MIGVFVSLDLFLFYVFWEVVLVPMYVMIGVWGGVDRIRAALKFFLYTMTGSMLMLAAMVYLVWTYQKLTGQWSWDYLALSRVVLGKNAQLYCFWAFSIAFFIKVPMWPVHTWLPDAHVQAPTAGSVILAAVMLKLGTYAYLRFSMGLFPGMASRFTGNLAGVAILGGILYGALVAWKQQDVKRLVAYSSVAHLGYVMLGLFSVTPSGMQGAVLQMVNHGISTGALFLLVGVIYDRRHTRMVDEFGGLAKVMPLYAALFVIVTLASIGVPGTNGFVGEFMVITGTFISERLGVFSGIQTVGAAAGVILAAVYMLGVVQKMFFGPLTNPKNKGLHDLNRREILVLAPLVAMIFVIGLFPNVFLDRIQGRGRARLRPVQDGLGPGDPLRRRARRQDPPRPTSSRPPSSRARPRPSPRRVSSQRPRATPVTLGGPPDPRHPRRCRAQQGGGAMKLDLYLGLSPLLLVVLGGSLLMVTEAFSHRREESDVRHAGPSSDLAIGTAITLFAGALAALGVWFVGPEKLAGLKDLAPYLILDRFTLFFTFVLCLGGGLAALLAGGYLPEHKIDRGEFYPLLTFSTVGAITLAASGDLLSLFLGLETMFARRLLAHRLPPRLAPQQRGGGQVLPPRLLRGGAPPLRRRAPLRRHRAHRPRRHPRRHRGGRRRGGPGPKVNNALVLVAAALVITGLLFKVSAVPFHMWTPDAYEGAPTPATGYMAVVVKSAAFAVLLRVLLVAFGQPELASWGAGWPPIIGLVAVLTMTVANLVAGRQESVKRMLAYSSIAHAGYLLVGVAATVRPLPGGGAGEAQGSVMFYLLAYTASTIGAFGALVLCGSRGAEAVTYEDLAGIGKRHPMVALAFSLFLLSLAGVPPTAGFFAKLYVVRAAIGANLYVLAVLLLLNSVLGAYYYLRVLVFMYMREPAPGAAVARPMRSGYVVTALVVAAVLVVVLGLWPTTSLHMAVEAALATR